MSSEHVNALSTKNGEIPASRNGARRRQKSRRTYSKHGLTTLKRAVNGLGNRALDKRTATAKALVKWRNDLIADLGGDVSTQQGAIIDLAVKSKLILDSIDTWLLVQPSLVNARKRSLLPVVKERQALADGLARYLSQLGLRRRAPRQETLNEITDEILAKDQEMENER